MKKVKCHLSRFRKLIRKIIYGKSKKDLLMDAEISLQGKLKGFFSEVGEFIDKLEKADKNKNK